MTPLRIRISLATPIVEGLHPILLDGLVAFACYQDALANGTLTGWDDFLEALPFERCARAEGWVWKASYLIPEERLGLAQRYINRKFWDQGYAELYGDQMLRMGRKGEPSQPTDITAVTPRQITDFEKEKQVLKTGAEAGLIETFRGQFKAESYMYPIAAVSAVTGFCVGDAAEIQRLLADHIRFLGKRARLEHGRVAAIDVVEDPAANIMWEQRPTPWKATGDAIPLATPLRPPYWRGDRRVMAWAPSYLSTDVLDPTDPRIPAD